MARALSEAWEARVARGVSVGAFLQSIALNCSRSDSGAAAEGGACFNCGCLGDTATGAGTCGRSWRGDFQAGAGLTGVGLLVAAGADAGAAAGAAALLLFCSATGAANRRWRAEVGAAAAGAAAGAVSDVVGAAGLTSLRESSMPLWVGAASPSETAGRPEQQHCASTVSPASSRSATERGAMMGERD